MFNDFMAVNAPRSGLPSQWDSWSSSAGWELVRNVDPRPCHASHPSPRNQNSPFHQLPGDSSIRDCLRRAVLVAWRAPLVSPAVASPGLTATLTLGAYL